MRTHSGLAAAAVAGILVLTPAPVALAGPGNGHGHTKTHATGHHHGKPAAKRFTATGKVTAVSGDQLTMHAKGGSHDLHGQDVTVTVPEEARVRRGGPAELADLQPGDHVMVNGRRTEAGLVARHVNASVPDTEDAEDVETGDEGTVDDGTVDDGTGDGTVDDGTVDDGSVDDGTVDDGTGDDGSTTGDTPTV